MGKRKSGFAGLIFYWSRRSESNGQPAVYDTAALPIELRRLIKGKKVEQGQLRR
jgi:hypothetical protein